MQRQAARVERRDRRDADLRRIEIRAAAAASTPPSPPPCRNCGTARCIENGRCLYCGQIQARNGVQVRDRVQVRNGGQVREVRRDIAERAHWHGCRLEHAANIGAVLAVRW
ncbi:MAG: hypothetical protein JO236_02440 [Mycobacterium sp.]|uniref:hypothetical protein n=1 Tax=Mycobacterium sp. TaxID=1785 RepID=UPI001EC32B08|nr:hypothetical protein [Mycobacterium sp.]MBW0016397.1 hypothetical protein [Mycobacterium sp.]